MALNFPDNPSVNDVYSDPTSGFSYQWDGTVWQSFSSSTLGQIKILDDISGSFNGSTQTFALTSNSNAITPANAQQIRVVLGGVVQDPADDYTVSSSNITFTSPPSGGLSFSGVVFGTAVPINTINDGSVTPAKLSTGGPSWNASGDLYVTGIATATTFSGNLTGNVTGNLTGNLTGEVNAAAFDTNSSGILVTGIATATTFSGNLTGNVTGEVDAAAFDTNSSGVVVTGIATATTFNGQVNAGVGTIGSVKIASGIITATSGVVTYYGDGSNLQGVVSGVELQSAGSSVGTAITAINFASGATLTTASAGISTITIAAGGSGEFNTGITSSVVMNPLSYASAVFTFPATAGKQYVINSLNASNVYSGLSTANLIAWIQDSSGNPTHITYNIPIVTGGLVEVLKNPFVAGPSDEIHMWTTDTGYFGISNAVEAYMNYTEYDDTEYIGVYYQSSGISTGTVGIFTSSTYPSNLQSIRITNKTDSGDYPVSVSITSGAITTYLAKDLIVPRYAVVDILDRQKRIEINDVVNVSIAQTSSIDVILAGKQITS